MSDFPVRLPTGWIRLDPVGPAQVAALPGDDAGHPAVVLTVAPGQGGDSAVLARELRMTHPGILILDEGEADCRRGVRAQRVLTAHWQNSRSVTTEVWIVDGDAPAVLCGAVDTARYAELGPLVRRMLRSYPS